MPVTLFTCPVGRTAVFRSVFVVNALNVGNVQALSVNGTGAGHEVWRATVGGGLSVKALDYLVMVPGDTLINVGAGATALDWSGFGSLLLGAPS